MISTLLGLIILVAPAAATGPVPVSRSGLAGIDGFTFYDPFCAHGCFRSFSPFTLPCSAVVHPGGHTTDNEAAYSLALCRASSFPYLSSIAWCIHLYCPKDVRTSKIETFWETEITGDVNILPEWSYGEIMANITEAPTEVASSDSMNLNRTMLTAFETWDETQATLVYFFRETVLESYYGLSLCLTTFGLPLVLTWLGYLPFMAGVLERINPWLYPSIIRSYNNHTWSLVGNIPTISQSLYIVILIILNIIFLAVGYKTLYPEHVMQWYENRYQELMAYFMWRTGVLAFCQMPVLFLFSTRNNILLWLTNWSQSTFILLHRWIARLFLFQTLLHSILALVLYQDTGSYSSSLLTEWWIWGCVATVATVILVFGSAYILRQRVYELFLISHIVMAAICVVGCWYHVYIGYENTFGYETWLYATIGVWFLDRLLRLARVLRGGFRHSIVTEISPTIVRVDIPSIRWAAPGHCVYVYFPTLNPLKPWENHPFSMVQTAALTRQKHNVSQPAADCRDSKDDTVQIRSAAMAHGSPYTTAGVTLFVRKNEGITKSIKPHHGLLTLVEGPYPTNYIKSVLQSDRLLLVGGGIGITGLLPFVTRHPNVKLLYSIKAVDQPFLATLGPLLDLIHEKQIVIGRRLNLDALLQDEAETGWSKIAVLVCGPTGMCNDIRTIVSRLSREKANACTFELEVDAFAW